MPQLIGNLQRTVPERNSIDFMTLSIINVPEY